MKAYINANGVLILTPETDTEGFAIRAWFDKSVVYQKDLARMEGHHFKGSSIEAYYLRVENEQPLTTSS